MSRWPTHEELLFSNLDVGLCWEWTGYVRPDGYGVVNFKEYTSPQRVHRVIWEWLVGVIPDGYELDHLCRNHRCANPDHLEPVTSRENARRGYSRAAINARKTECKHGHAFTEENTIHRKAGRACRTCHNAAQRARWRRNHESNLVAERQ